MKRLLLCFSFLLLFAHSADAADKVLDVQSFTTPAGIEVWLVEDTSVPVVSMDFSFSGGLAYDPEGKPGVGRLVSILLDEGAGDMTSQQFQSVLSNDAIGLSFNAGRDAFHGQIKTLKENEDEAFRLLSLALAKPRFDADAIARMRIANSAGIRHDMGDPGWLVARTFNGMVFKGHPYSTPGYGTLESMKEITRDDLLGFVHAQFARNVLQVAIAGDIDKAAAAKAVDAVFGSLPAKAAPVAEPEATLAAVGETILLPLDTPQTTVLAGEAGIKRKDKDWQAAQIMTTILGGGSFDARLMREIRKKRGLTYGIYASLSAMKHAALLQVSFSASNDKVGEALNILRQQWAEMEKDGAFKQEVADAKAYLTGSLPLGLTSTDDISGVLNSLQREGLDADYINRRNAEIEAVTVSDVNRVAARLLKPENLTFILVGQPKGVTADITLDHAPGLNPPENNKK